MIRSKLNSILIILCSFLILTTPVYLMATKKPECEKAFEKCLDNPPYNMRSGSVAAIYFCINGYLFCLNYC